MCMRRFVITRTMLGNREQGWVLDDGVSISEMTHVSHFFVVMAVLFGIITVIMYFTLDIRRCWRIVRGGHSAEMRDRVPYDITADTEWKRNSEISEKTEKLVSDKTEALFLSEETIPLETMTLIQDIVMTDAGNCVNP